MDDQPDKEDIPPEAKKKKDETVVDDAPVIRDDSGPEASEAPEEEGSATRP